MNINQNLREEEPLEIFLKLRVTSDQLEQLKKLAHSNYMPTSTFARQIIAKYLNNVSLV